MASPDYFITMALGALFVVVLQKTTRSRCPRCGRVFSG